MSIGPVLLPVDNGVMRVHRMTRSISGSPLATPCLNSRALMSPVDCCARSASGIAAADAVAVCMNSRREVGMKGAPDPNAFARHRDHEDTVFARRHGATEVRRRPAAHPPLSV